MTLSEESFEKFLPKYLSAENYETLLQELKAFPENLDSRIYTIDLEKEIIYQGDGMKNLPIVNLMDIDQGVKRMPCLVLSNTCDMDVANKRFFPASMMYAPIVNMHKYTEILKKNGISERKIESHLENLKKQRLTQIMYLPAYAPQIEESVVFLDRILHIDNQFIKREDLNELRLFSLSDYGFYLLIFKLSVHFSRIQEKVNRGSIH